MAGFSLPVQGGRKLGFCDIIQRVVSTGNMVLSAIMRHVALSLCLMTMCGMAAAQEDVERGQTLATKLCSECHAVGRTGASPQASAPTFRSIDDHTDLDEFVGRLRQGGASAHPDRPAFRISRDDADATVAYMRSVQGP